MKWLLQLETEPQRRSNRLFEAALGVEGARELTAQASEPHRRANMTLGMAIQGRCL